MFTLSLFVAGVYLGSKYEKLLKEHVSKVKVAVDAALKSFK